MRLASLMPVKLSVILLTLCIASPLFAAPQAQLAKLITDNPDNGDEFGWAVEITETEAFVGARGDAYETVFPGLVYAFACNNGSWDTRPTLVSGDPQTGDQFGSSIAVSGDVLMIGAPHDGNGGLYAGLGHVFNRDASTWVEVAQLTEENPTAYDAFSRAIDMDGDYAVITVPGDDDGYNYSGSAYIFHLENGTWIRQKQLHASDPAALDEFGISASISGNYVIVGACRDDNLKGSAHIFIRSGTNWNHQQKITDSAGVAGDNFGKSVSIYGDYAVVGAPGRNDETGALFVFKRTDTTWSLVDTLTSTSSATGDELGAAVEIYDDRIVGGAPGQGSDTGTAYVFSNIGSQWVETYSLVADDATAGDRFGSSIALCDSWTLIGAPEALGTAGAAYLYGSTSFDCNDNGIPDVCDISCTKENPITLNGCAHDYPSPRCGTQDDCNTNGIPDDCEPDCNSNGIADSCDISSGASVDCDDNGIPDECEDCNNNGIGDACEITAGSAMDCNSNGIPDDCEMDNDVVLLELDFEEGIPHTWSKNGLWHSTDACPQSDPCSPTHWAYFGQDGSCDFDTDSVVTGVLSSPEISIPGTASGASLSFCSVYNGEGGTSTNGLDAAWVSVNGELVDDISAISPIGVWETRKIDLGSYTGETVTIAWHFDSGDDDRNDLLGWQIDNIVVIAGSGVNNDCNGNGILDECDIAGATSTDCNTNGIPDDCDIDGGTSNDCNDNQIPDDCESTEDCNTNGILDICESLTIYVDHEATGGGNDGTSWENAYTDLQTAITAAEAICITQEIWVADGTYTPAPPAGEREASFHLYNNMALYGGFSGNEDTRETRDPSSNITILSGDLNGDDNGLNNNDENSYCIVRTDNVDETAILDGFVITRGNANGPNEIGEDEDKERGAALYLYQSHPRINQCKIRDCYSHTGGVFAYRANPTFNKCTFKDNTGDWGAVMYCYDNSSPTITNSVFSGNSAVSRGGAVYSTAGSTPTFVNCVFHNNNVTENGGAICCQHSTTEATLINCTVYGNSSTLSGGGIGLLVRANVTLVNTIVWGNIDSNGTDASAQINEGDGTATVSYSCIQDENPNDASIPFGGTTNHNIDDNPLFNDAGNDDFGLSPISPCIDAGNNNPNLEIDIPKTDVSGFTRFLDALNIPDTGTGTAPIVDMGAYEHQADCNSNGIPDPIEVIEGSATDCDINGVLDECELSSRDCNSNGIVDACDINDESSNDCNDNNQPDECEIVTTSTAPGGPFFCTDSCDPDCNDNGVPDSCDISWGTSTDCDYSGIPDECKSDCNTNGTPDVCEPRFTFTQSSPRLSPLYSGSAQTYTFFSPQPALNDVILSFSAVGDLGNSAKKITIALNGYTAEAILKTTGVDCPAINEAQISINASSFNALTNKANAIISMTPSASVQDVCSGGSYITVTMSYDTSSDCNENGVLDSCDIANFSSLDINTNSVPDDCEDCDNNGLPDQCDINCEHADGACDQPGCGLSTDENENGIIDICEDCNTNGIPDECDIDCEGECDFLGCGQSSDVNGNYIPDECEDCNYNGYPDEQDISGGTSLDCNDSGIPDECELENDCNTNSVPDECDISGATSQDCNTNSIPDECELGDDCNENQIPDECDILPGATSNDCNSNSIPDECETGNDCNTNGIPDDCDISYATSTDCNTNNLPDECDVYPIGTAADCDGNLMPDDCQDDDDNDGIINPCDECPGTTPGDAVADNGCSIAKGGCCFETKPCEIQDQPTCEFFGGAYLGSGTHCGTDSDGDTFTDCDDVCPFDPLKTDSAGECGCGKQEIYTDGDTVPDCIDLCPDTPAEVTVDSNGCPLVGACCTPTGGCSNSFAQISCEGFGGIYQGNGSFCSDGCALGTVPGDYTGDDIVDLDDYTWFAECIDSSGPKEGVNWIPPSPQCRKTFDFDGDNDVDMFDYAVFQELFDGP